MDASAILSEQVYTHPRLVTVAWPSPRTYLDHVRGVAGRSGGDDGPRGVSAMIKVNGCSVKRASSASVFCLMGAKQGRYVYRIII